MFHSMNLEIQAKPAAVITIAVLRLHIVLSGLSSGRFE
jgi:hypothetical protein